MTIDTFVQTIFPYIDDAGECLVLDTAKPSAANRYSLFFRNPKEVFSTRNSNDVPALLTQLSRISKKFWVAGYLSYEAAYGMEPRFIETLKAGHRCSTDCLWFGIFEKPLIYDHRQKTWNDKVRAQSKAVHRFPADCAIQQTISRKRYIAAIKSIKQLIAAGDTYQVNFSYDNRVVSPLSGSELYVALRLAQPVPFGAYIKTRSSEIVSLSPELFFSRNGRSLSVKPMKGTAPRGRTTKEDTAIAQALLHDEKNRSENVMIVDLERNDLGKLCEHGSVITTDLFSVEKHPTVFQMTSGVRGTLRKGIEFSDIMQALFPSGSVTGAPKIRSMEIIRSLEKSDRNVYCGAIGYVSPQGRSVFSVPIRTLQKSREEKEWHFRVGSGVIADSREMGEWLECADKTGFLRKKPVDFQIVETLLFSQGKMHRTRLHRARLLDAAQYFAFNASAKQWNELIRTINGRLQLRGEAYKVRILLDKLGNFSWEAEKITKVPVSNPPIIALSSEVINPDNAFLYHKTTYRPWYEAATQKIRSGEVFDVIYCNTRKQITEGARSNLFVKYGAMLYTPPVSCGVLPGILRQTLIDAGRCKEKILYTSDLKKADALFCGNSVRGLVPVMFNRN